MTRRPGPSRTEWVATPPGGARPVRPRPRRRPYSGPPKYPAGPRWGFPLVGWRWPLAVPLRPPENSQERVRSSARNAVIALRCTAAVAGLAAGAELLRYGLLLISRTQALSRPVLVLSDLLVNLSGLGTWLLGALSGVLTVLWALRARELAARWIGVRNARSDAQVVAGVLVPGLNLVVPGSALAELEHTVLIGRGDRDRGTRPFPSVLVRVWWACWVVTVLLSWIAIAWGFRGGVQAMADGVVLHAWNDGSAAVLAVLTARVVDHLTRLLLPADPAGLRRYRVLAVRGAPPVRRRARPQDAAR